MSIEVGKRDNVRNYFLKQLRKAGGKLFTITAINANVNAYYNAYKTKYSTKAIKYTNQTKIDTDNKAQQRGIDDYFTGTAWVDDATKYMLVKQDVSTTRVNEAIDAIQNKKQFLQKKDRAKLSITQMSEHMRVNINKRSDGDKSEEEIEEQTTIDLKESDQLANQHVENVDQIKEMESFTRAALEDKLNNCTHGSDEKIKQWRDAVLEIGNCIDAEEKQFNQLQEQFKQQQQKRHDNINAFKVLIQNGEIATGILKEEISKNKPKSVHSMFVSLLNQLESPTKKQ